MPSGAALGDGGAGGLANGHAHGPGRGLGRVVADYVQISKPRILLLLLVVAWAAMAIAAGGWPPLKAWLGVTLGGALSTASSGAFNHVLEREQDARMGRTAGRPVAEGRISVAGATLYAAVMGALALAVPWLLGLRLAAMLNGLAILYYVLVYTVLLKPSTPQNIVIGGFAGSFPALIGWAAVTGSLAWPDAAPAYLLALLVFLWTPAHFWALALLYKDDYERAGYPMMPSMKGEASTRRHIVAYSLLTLACSLLLAWPAGTSWIYGVAAAVLGGILVLRSARLLRDPAPPRYRAFFLFTIQYLGLLLIALMVDRIVPPMLS